MAAPTSAARCPSIERDNPLFVGSLAKSFQVLEALNTAGRAVGLTELAQLAGLDRSGAAPLPDPQDRPLGAVNIAVPSPRWQLQEVLDRLVPHLLKTVASINRELRHF